MNLDELATRFTRPAQASDLLGSGRETSRFSDFTRSETRADPLVATLVLQVLRYTRTFRRQIADAVPSGQHTAIQLYVLPNTSGPAASYHVLALHPGYVGTEPRRVDLMLRTREMEEAFALWQTSRLTASRVQVAQKQVLGRDTATDLQSESLVSLLTLAGVREAFEMKPFDLIIAKPPEVQYTCVAVPRLDVHENPASSANSTAGCVVEQKSTRSAGVTAAYHAVANWGPVIPGTTAAHVRDTSGKWSGTIAGADAVSDSVFVKLPSPLPASRPVGSAGPLMNVSPRKNDTCTFDGLASGKQQAVIQAWDADLPFVFGANQLKVLTDLVTTSGDSGAALIDPNDYVVGFSFYCTKPSAAFAYSAWIWAHSVFDYHDLRPL